MTKVTKISDDAFSKLQPLIGQGLSQPEALDKLLSVGDAEAVQGNHVGRTDLPGADEPTIDEQIKREKLEGLKLDNTFKAFRNIRIERSLSPDESMRLSDVHAVTPREETGWVNDAGRKVWLGPALREQTISCLESSCAKKFPAGFEATRRNHMMEVHGWSMEQCSP